MTHYFSDRFASHDTALRAADADRERTAELLRQSHTEGRLDTAELQQRIEGCYEAKTLGELDELVEDLPQSGDTEGHRSVGMLRRRRWPLVPLASILIALLVLSAATGHHHGHHFFWLWIPLVFFVWRMTWWRGRRWAGARRGPDGWL